MDNNEDLKTQLKAQVRQLTDENTQLREKNEQICGKLGALQSNLDHVAVSKSELSSKLLSSEEEKLKISKDLIEAQIQSNKMREQYEAEAYELKNKILLQDSHLMDLEVDRDRLQREVEYAKGRLETVEKSHKELAEELISLKSSYIALTEEHERELSRNEELSAELLGLARAKDALLQQRDDIARSRAPQAEAELQRVRALVGGMSQSRTRLEELAVSEQERMALERNLLGKHDEIKEELEKMRTRYEEQQRRLEEKLMAMGKEQQDNKKAISNTQLKLAEQCTALASSQTQLKEVEAENSRLQLHVKELNEAYRARLVRYLRELASYVDRLSGSQGVNRVLDQEQMRKFVDEMLQDIRTSHRSREEQLSSAARVYKKRLQRVTKSHEALLIAYRMQREQILTLSEHGLDPGPPESHFCLTDSELQLEQSRELQRLREDKARLESRLRDVLGQKNALSHPVQSVTLKESGSLGNITEEAWADIRKELREFVHSTLVGLEKERAQLLTRATVAEGQVSELQEYVDKHLGRYKQEVTRLRHLLATETGRPSNATEPHRRVAHHSKKGASNEV